MANHNPKPRVGKGDIAPNVRIAFTRALELIEADSGMTFPQLMQQAIEEHGLLAVLDRVSKYTVREQEIKGSVTHDHSHRVEIIQAETQRIIDSFACIPESISAEAALQDESVLPDPGGVQSH